MIGEHVVTVAPVEYTSPEWLAPMASNPNMTTNIQGWKEGVFSNPYTWAAPGVAKPPAVIAASSGLFRDTAYPVARDPWSCRIRATVTVSGPGWVVLGLHVAATPQAAHDGPAFFPNDAVNIPVWNWVPAAGTYTLDNVVDPTAAPARLIYLGPYCDFHLDGAGVPVSVDMLELTHHNPGAVDLSCLVDQVAINHGRADTTSQPAASSATVDLAWGEGESLPATVDVGARVDVFTTVPGFAPVTRFTGRITDVSLGWDDAGGLTPVTGLAQVIAVGTIADLGRRVVGATPFPTEDDGDRVARVASLAGMPLDPFQSDPGTVQLLARDVDSKAALAVMHEAAASASGMVWQTRDGQVSYADAGHRHNVPVSLTLDACDVLVTPTWVRNLDGLTNDVSVGYGVAAGGTEQPRYLATDPTSIARWGRYAFTTATELAALADAQAVGNLAMLRNNRPVWVLSAIPVDVDGLDAAETFNLLTLDLNSLVQLTGLPYIAGAPTEFPAWVEGWTETLTHGTHALELALSDYCRTSVPVTWNEPYATTWDGVPDAGTRTWDAAVCWGGPIPGIGRWDDTATALRWDQVQPATTWDTWNGA